MREELLASLLAVKEAAESCLVSSVNVLKPFLMDQTFSIKIKLCYDFRNKICIQNEGLNEVINFLDDNLKLVQHEHINLLNERETLALLIESSLVRDVLVAHRARSGQGLMRSGPFTGACVTEFILALATSTSQGLGEVHDRLQAVVESLRKLPPQSLWFKGFHPASALPEADTKFVANWGLRDWSDYIALRLYQNLRSSLDIDKSEIWMLFGQEYLGVAFELAGLEGLARLASKPNSESDNITYNDINTMILISNGMYIMLNNQAVRAAERMRPWGGMEESLASEILDSPGQPVSEAPMGQECPTISTVFTVPAFDGISAPCSSQDETNHVGHGVGGSKATVVLGGPHDPPMVRGKQKPCLSPARFKIVQTLLNAGQQGLTGDELTEKSGRGGAINTLKALAKGDSDWGSVIVLPGKPGMRYRLLFDEV
jgi:hypothetical protein